MTHVPVRCRDGARSDAAVIASFQIAMARETEGLELDRATCERGVLGVFDVPARGRYFVAEHDGRVVGCLLIIPEWSDWRNGTVWWIHSVYVAPDARRLGAFRALYSHVRSLVQKDESLRGLRLYVDKRNAPAQQVYRRLGMSDEHYVLFEWMKTF